jgi:hypothetical protein
MAMLTLELPVHEKQRGFNLRRRQRNLAVCPGWRDKLSGADSDAVLKAVHAVPETGSVPLTWRPLRAEGQTLDKPCLLPLRRKVNEIVIVS